MKIIHEKEASKYTCFMSMSAPKGTLVERCYGSECMAWETSVTMDGSNDKGFCSLTQKGR